MIEKYERGDWIFSWFLVWPWTEEKEDTWISLNLTKRKTFLSQSRIIIKRGEVNEWNWTMICSCQIWLMTRLCNQTLNVNCTSTNNFDFNRKRRDWIQVQSAWWSTRIVDLERSNRLFNLSLSATIYMKTFDFSRETKEKWRRANAFELGDHRQNHFAFTFAQSNMGPVFVFLLKNIHLNDDVKKECFIRRHDRMLDVRRLIRRLPIVYITSLDSIDCGLHTISQWFSMNRSLGSEKITNTDRCWLLLLA